MVWSGLSEEAMMEILRMDWGGKKKSSGEK
jgi:hypothetical protein